MVKMQAKTKEPTVKMPKGKLTPTAAPKMVFFNKQGKVTGWIEGCK